MSLRMFRVSAGNSRRASLLHRNALGLRQGMVSPGAVGGRGYWTSLSVSTDREKGKIGGNERQFSTKSKPYVSKGSYGSGAPAPGKAPVGRPQATASPTGSNAEAGVRTTGTNAVSASAKSKMHFQRKVTVVDTKEGALKALKVLESDPEIIWACDTEVMDIDLKLVGPVGNGRVTCVSIFGGPDVDFGDGPGGSLWVDNIGPEGELLQMFKAWFEDDKYKKVWHNYSFDRHVMGNEDINCGGFYGDTFHMARLHDTSREKVAGTSGDGYSLAALSESLLDSDLLKTKMIDLFGVAKLKKDGTEGKVKTLPPIREIQESPEHREDWIWYSALDAISTWWVHNELKGQLQRKEWVVGRKRIGDMYNFYREYLCAFGELLTEMEKNGIKIDTKIHLREAEERARADRARMEELFIDWASKYCPDARKMNIKSSVQVGQFLFGHWKDKKRQAGGEVREFEIEKDEEELAEEQKDAVEKNPYINHSSPDLKQLLKERKLKVSGKKADLVERLMAYDSIGTNFHTKSKEELAEMCISRGLPHEGKVEKLIDLLIQDVRFAQSMAREHDKAEASAIETKKPSKKKTISINSVGATPVSFSPAGTPQVSAAVLRKLSGSNLFEDEKDAVYGSLYEHFGSGERGREACQAVGALAQCGQIDATITNFLVPLQTLVDKKDRVHCALNLNTETGRLSSRKPNLQNQPALEKDQYKIRDAFIAEPGNTLIVADYGQLELRLMAHMTTCESMVQAFKEGGCFHSRTAMGMYPYIKDSVDNGDCLLEWDYSKGQPTVPLVKDKFGSERRKAKTLNFSIAYGKTVHGLAADWGITTDEAQETLNAWYNDRPEVRDWQEKTRNMAKGLGFVRTIMGRYRELPDAGGNYGPAVGHALRAAINSPIQGSAADVVMMAMLRLWRSEVLKDMGWRLLLQIHDEVILEGPKETKDKALAEVISCMEDPFDSKGLLPISVHLDVDAKSADTWYQAK